VSQQGGGIYHIWLTRRRDWRKFGYGFDGSTDEMARKEFKAILDGFDTATAAIDVLGS